VKETRQGCGQTTEDGKRGLPISFSGKPVTIHHSENMARSMKKANVSRRSQQKKRGERGTVRKGGISDESEVEEGGFIGLWGAKQFLLVGVTGGPKWEMGLPSRGVANMDSGWKGVC